MTLPIAPAVLPSDLNGQPNGNLDISLLVPLHERGKLHHLAARAWRALVVEAGKQGLPLTFTYGGMYRPYADQESLFRQRYTTSYIAGASRKWWNNQWWYLRPGNAMAATPGTSNHGLGLAIDTAFDKDPSDGLGPDDAVAITGHPQFGWFRDNVARFGFSFELQSEPWHIRYVAGDAVPTAVKAFEDSINRPPFDPANGKWGTFPTQKKRATKLGDTGNRVAYLEGVLKLKLGQDIKNVNSDFGDATEKAVRNVQKFFKLPVDGWVGPTTWKVIDWAAVQP
jgi:LAS superfamily LD-carboxypeptidase LdcB